MTWRLKPKSHPSAVARGRAKPVQKPLKRQAKPSTREPRLHLWPAPSVHKKDRRSRAWTRVPKDGDAKALPLAAPQAIRRTREPSRARSEWSGPDGSELLGHVPGVGVSWTSRVQCAPAARCQTDQAAEGRHHLHLPGIVTLMGRNRACGFGGKAVEPDRHGRGSSLNARYEPAREPARN